MEPIHVAYTPDQFRFEYEPDKFMTFDIIEAELAVERFLVPEGDEEVQTADVLQRVQSWISQLHGVELSTTQAWSLWQAVRAAYEAHKKKLFASLTSAIATASTPGDALRAALLASNGNSPESEPSQK